MDRHQVRYALLKICLLALVGSTWVLSSFIFATRPEEAEVDALTSLVRLPASLPGQIQGMGPQVKINEPIEMDVVRVPCWDKTDASETETSAHWVRLIGKACENANDADIVSVRNLTNGFSATIFPTQLRKSLSTDFIPLQAGRNEILIRFNQGDGVAVESQVSFMRE